ncbi:hypothetical protein AB0O20_17585 [Streptomyces kronopolitis]|uniref:hypothetical protein n=1 Tax=Streptomyces kronopolitis TaxID=1612435 RepID=UPI00341F7D05
MSFPPPPPNQPPPDPSGGYGPGGYGPPPGGNQPPAGFGPPAGGYGPGGPQGPGGWQQPPGPPGGGGNGKVIAAIIAGGALVLAVVITLVVVNTGDSGSNRAQPSASQTLATPSGDASATPTYGPDPTKTPTYGPDPSGTPTDSDFASGMPRPSDGKLPFYLLKVGDCYDLPAGGGGNNDAASCRGPHDAEVVTTHRLDAGLTTESAIKGQASSLCRGELERKAARQPAGTTRGTYIQYPSLSGYKLGIKSVSCSLMADRTGTKKLTKPLT